MRVRHERRHFSNILKHEDDYSMREREREIARTLHPLYLSAGDAHLCGEISCPLEVRSTECHVMIRSGLPIGGQVLATMELLSK